MYRFKVWIDGNSEKNSVETDFGIIEAGSMHTALDVAAEMAGYRDHAHMASELGWEESEFNIVFVDEDGDEDYYGLRSQWQDVG